MDKFSKNSKFMKCFITNINVSKEDIEIWCQIDNKLSSRVESAIDSLHNHLSDSFAITSQNLRPALIPEVGKNYLTRMKNDLHFHRAIVTHIDEDTTEASVLFVDFGVEDWVPFNHLIEFEQLFEVEPLAQKFFLADIKPKDNEWNLSEVKRCLQPFVMTVFQCEVITVIKNTECIRVYDQFFNQPLVQSLVKHCNGVLSYPSFGKKTFEAIDLRVGQKQRVKPIDSGLKDRQSFDLKPIPRESIAIPKTTIEKKSDVECNVNKENVFHTKEIESNKNLNVEELNETNAKDLKISSIEPQVEWNIKLMANKELQRVDSHFSDDQNEAIKQSKVTKEAIKESKITKEVIKEPEVSKRVSNESEVTKEVPKPEVTKEVPKPEVTKEISKELEVLKEPEVTKEVLNEQEVTEESVSELNNSEVNSIDLNDLSPIKDIERTPSEDWTNMPVTPEKPEVDQKDICKETSVELTTIETNNGPKSDPKSNGINESVVDQLNVSTSGDIIEKMTNGESKQSPTGKRDSGYFGPNIGCELSQKVLGTKDSIYLTVNPLDNTFYCQLSSQFDSITELTNKMSDYYKMSFGTDIYGITLSDLKIGDIVAARFSGDKLWYRATVKEITGTRLKVVYIDFGNEELVDIKECKKMAKEFDTTVTEAQVLHCSTIGSELPIETIEKYINDLTEVKCQFVELIADVLKIKIISDK